MGQIITFYSYKGGVGRSMALANTAALLARWGYKTLIIDWDLEAPGLENFFKEYSDADMSQIADRKGLVDLISASVKETGEDSAQPDWHDFLVTIKLKEAKAPLHLLTAGQRNAGYFQKVRNFDAQQYYREQGGGYFIETLREQWKKEYQVVLIDSRTGVTDIGGICTIHLPDILVLVFTATEQGLQGAVKVARNATLERQNLPSDRLKLLTVPLPSRFDDSVEYVISQKWLDRISLEVTDLYADWLPADVKRREMLEITKIPYRAYFSFGEKLAVIEQGTVDPTGLGYAMETLTALLASNLKGADRLRTNRADFVGHASNTESRQTLKPDYDLQAILDVVEKHKAWLESGGADGSVANFNRLKLRGIDLSRAALQKALLVEADLSTATLLNALLTEADLSRASLRGANLQSAWLLNANLQKADLGGTNLQGALLAGANLQTASLEGATLISANLDRANLEEANLSGADLKDASFTDANLTRAVLTDVSGLTSGQLRRANLSEAKLADSIGWDKELHAINVLSKGSFMLLLLLVIGCFYSGYVIISMTTDAPLMTDKPYSLTVVSAHRFFVIFPLILTGLYIYFHSYTQRLWEEMANLPAVFPDGQNLNTKLPKLLFSSMVSAYFEQLKRPSDKVKTPSDRLERPAMAAERFGFIFQAWFLTPLVLILFWARYLPLHDWTITSMHIILVAAVVAAGLNFYQRAVRTLKGETS